jgi:hypothetical protein
MYWLETVHIMKQLNMSHTNILHNVMLCYLHAAMQPCSWCLLDDYYKRIAFNCKLQAFEFGDPA